jgi:hypothetical protein
MEMVEVTIMYATAERENPTQSAELNGESQIRLNLTTSRDSASRLHANLKSCSSEDLTEASCSLQEVELATLLAFDTIVVRTVNSHYRIVLLDPETGRSLLEGGQFTEAAEGRVFGSSSGGSSMPRIGWLGVGLRFEAWANGMYIRSSPIQSLSVQHQTPSELAEMSLN